MPNSRPAVGAMADRTVSNGAVHTVTVPVSDADAGDAHTLSASSDDTSVASVTTSGRYAYLRGVGRGTATITVKATDDSGAGNAESAPETFRATVPNSHPSVDAVTAVTVAVGETVTLEPGIADPDAGDTHTVAASSADASIATVAVSGTRLTITGVARGRTTVTVAATDDSGGPDATSAARTFAVTVTPTTNSRPVVGALGDIELAAGTTRTATAGVTDADADDTHTVSANSTDLGVATVSVSGDEIEVAGVAAGTATITVTATDDSGAANATSEPATFAATVTATGTNTAPLVHPVGHVVVTEGATVTVTVGFEDGDGDGLTLSAVSDDPAVAAVSASSTRLVLPGTATSTELLLSGEAVGTAAVTVTAADGVATSTPMTFPVTIVARSPMAAARVFWVEPEVSGGDYTVNWNLPPGGTWELREYGAEGASRFRVDGTASARSFTGIPPGRYTYTLWRCVPGKNICFGTGTGSVLAVVVREDELLIETDTKPGNLPYRTGVTKGGDAYVDVPVAAVPGVNGLQPRLSIDYGGGRDLERLEQELAGDVLGYGWHLSGLSAIRRCVKDEEDADGISLDTSDRLCLDGEPLVLIGGYPLAAGAEYRTLRESFAKITLKADPNGNWFEVLLPDGGKREYGRTEDSLLRTRALQPAPFVWSVNKETDAFGNEMSYEYHEDEGTLVRHPKMIVYGHPDASGNGDAEIRFVYQGRRDIATVEVAGIGRRQWLRLHRIEAWQGGSKVREYRLESVLSPEGWRRLNRLQLCGYGTDGAAQCLAPLAVEWTTPAQGMEAYKTCVGGLTDALGARTQFVYGTLTKGNPHPFVLAPGDMPFGDFEDPADARPLPPADLPVDPPFNPADRAVKPVVVTVSRDDGVGGMRHTRYAYLGRGWKSTRNWGFLGFAAIREKDDASGIATYTQYRLDFPHLGRPAAVARYHGEFGSSPQPETLWKRYAAYAEWTVTHGTSAAMSTLPYVLESTDLVYEGGTLLGAVQTSDAPEVEDGLVKRTVRTTRSAHRATARTSPAGSPWGHVAGYALGEVQRRAETTLEFGNRTTGGLWLIGFAEGETVEHFDGNETSARRMTATRTPYGNTLAVGGSQRFPGDADLALTTAHGYDAQGNRTRTEVVSGAHLPAPPAGKERAWIADVFEAGRYPARSENPERHVESAAYDAGLGLATSVTDANGRETLLEYDAFGRKTGRTRVWDDATKTTTEYAWCAGAECAMAVVRSSCGGGAGSLSVTAVMKSTTTAPDAPRTVRYFDRLGRLVRTETEAFAGGAARRAEVFHDARGRVLCETTPHHAGQAAGYVSYGYDVRGRVVRTIRPDGGAAAAAYGAARHGTTATVVETVKRRQGTGTATATTRTTTRTYNFLGELVETVEGAARPAGSDDRVKTTYAYDGSGLATTVTAGATGATGGVATTFGYDAAGNRTSVTNPNMGTAATGASARFEYDGLGRVRERTDGRGTTAYEYDLLGRPKKRTDPGGGVAIWGWDPANGKGLPGSRSYGAAFSETYVYDADARLKTATTAIAAGGRTESFRTTHAYDDRGRPSSTTHPSGAAVAYGYNAQGYMATVSSGSTTLVDYRGADAWGNSTEEVYGNGVATVRGFAAATGRLESIATSRGTGPTAATMQADAYAWRSDGSLHSRTSGGTTETFAYDALNRLTSATTDLAADRVLSYDYDPRGNLESKTSSATADADVTGYSYGAADNRLDEVRVRGAMRTLHYDQSGHVTRYEAAGDDRFVEWDGRGLATEVRLAASATAATSTALDAFAYGPDGARFHRRSEWKEGDATRTEETYYAGRHEKTYRADGSIVERTRIGTAVVHVKAMPAPDANGDRGPSTSSFEYLHRDHLGSVRSVTDESGAELAVLAHDPYGGRRRTDWTAGLTAASSTALVGTHGRRVSRGFTGHEHLDRTGLVHMNGRVYDPQLGRFLSPDPVVADPSGSQGWNLYSYVGNNPLSRTDPTGLIQAGAMCNISTYVFCMDGGGGGGAARTVTVTTTAHVFGVHVYHTPVWRSDWEWVWVPSFESGRFVVVNRGHYEWISQVVPYITAVRSSRQVATPEQAPANEPAGGTFVGAPAPAGNGGSPARPVAFVGGANDKENDLVYGIYGKFRDGSPTVPAVYFTHDQGDALAKWIDLRNAMGTKPNVIGHSWGAATAATKVSEGHEVHELRTVDPVGRSRPDFNKVAQFSEIWNNYHATGGKTFSWSNFAAGLGGAWNGAPGGFADNHLEVEMNHDEICWTHCNP